MEYIARFFLPDGVFYPVTTGSTLLKSASVRFQSIKKINQITKQPIMRTEDRLFDKRMGEVRNGDQKVRKHLCRVPVNDLGDSRTAKIIPGS